MSDSNAYNLVMIGDVCLKMDELKLSREHKMTTVEVIQLLKECTRPDVTFDKEFEVVYDPRDKWVKCSNCGHSTTVPFAREYKFCPKCGLRVRGVNYE